jgi:hypothetical protein
MFQAGLELATWIIGRSSSFALIKKAAPAVRRTRTARCRIKTPAGSATGRLKESGTDCAGTDTIFNPPGAMPIIWNRCARERNRAQQKTPAYGYMPGLGKAQGLLSLAVLVIDTLAGAPCNGNGHRCRAQLWLEQMTPQGGHTPGTYQHAGVSSHFTGWQLNGRLNYRHIGMCFSYESGRVCRNQ